MAVAAKSLQNLKPWPKGVSGNTGGGPTLPLELRKIRSLTPLEMNKIISKYGELSVADLKALDINTIPASHACVVTIMKFIINNHSYKAFEVIFDRALGKPTEVNDPPNSDLNLHNRSKKELHELIDKLFPEE